MSTIFAQWKQSLNEALPLQNLGGAMPQWKYAPVGETEDGGHPSKRSFVANVRDCFYSKAFWRISLVVCIFLLMANLFGTAQLRKFRYEEPDMTAEEVADNMPADDTDWSQFAYCQYVTNEEYLCNSLMIFEALVRLEAKAERLMMYPELWTVGENSNTGRLLAQARDDYGVRLVPIHVQHFEGDLTWADSFTKLLAFNQTRYKRVLSLDSDATILQPMDELFNLPSAPVAMPRAYWMDGQLSSQLVLVEPSEFEFNRILDAFSSRENDDFDMEIVNELYGDSCFIIPHRNYDLLTGEFKSTDHSRYLGNAEEEWDPDKILAEAKFLHYSDWPYPKPWIPAAKEQTEREQPKCAKLENGKEDCRDREKWLWFYKDFRERRANICGDRFAISKRDE